MKKIFHLSTLALFAWLGFAATSFGVIVPFTETFATNDSNWLNGDSSAPDWFSTGGVSNSSYISWEAPDFNSGTGGFGGDPLKIMFRANNSTNASGDAFVGDWLSGGVTNLTLSVRHNYTSDLNLYARIAGVGGAGASLANSYTITPNTWTSISIPITDSNPPFVSYGSSTFNGVFTNVQNLQLGLYLPADVDFSGLRMDVDNVSVVPEPATSAILIATAFGMALIAPRRRRNCRG